MTAGDWVFVATILVCIVLFLAWLVEYTWNIKWRKNIRIGDTCFFVNIVGTKTICKIELIDADRKQAMVLIDYGMQSYATVWMDVKMLRIY